MKDVIRSPRAVGLRVLPVSMMVVHKRAIHHHAAVRSQRIRQQIRRIRRRASIARRSRLPFAVRLHCKSRKVRNQLINLIRLRLPPRNHRRVQRIVGRQPANLLRARNIHTQRHTHAPRPHRIRNALYPRQHLRLQKHGGVIDVVDIASIDPHRSQQLRILAYLAKVLTHMARIEKNAPACITALNRTIRVIPLIHPANRHSRRLMNSTGRNVMPCRKGPHQRKCAIQQPLLSR